MIGQKLFYPFCQLGQKLPRYFPNSLEDLIPSSLFNGFNVTWICVRREDLGFVEIDFLTGELAKFLKNPFTGEIILFGYFCKMDEVICKEKMRKYRSISCGFKANPITRWEFILDELSQIFFMQIMKMYKDKGSFCLISLEGRKKLSLFPLT